MSRKKSRIAQMQILFQMDINKDYSLESLNLFLENFSFQENEEEYIKNTIPDILEHKEEIDSLIKKNLKGWSLNRLANVDRSILRIAIYEILFREDIPGEVSINEAIEIAKKYGSKESSKFINGILGSVYRSLGN